MELNNLWDFQLNFCILGNFWNIAGIDKRKINFNIKLNMKFKINLLATAIREE